MEQKLISVKQLSEVLGVSLQRAYQLVKERRVRSVRLGPKQIRVDANGLWEDLQASQSKE